MEYYKIELLIEITFLSKKRLYFCTVKASDDWSIYDKSICQTNTQGEGRGVIEKELMLSSKLKLPGIWGQVHSYRE